MITNFKTNSRELEALLDSLLEDASPGVGSPEFIQFGEDDALNIERLIKQFQPTIDRVVEHSIDSWINSYRQQLNQLVAILETFSKKLEQLSEMPSGVQEGERVAATSQVRQELKLALKAIHQWSELLTQDIFSADIWKDLKNQFIDELKPIPETAEIPLPPDYWTAKWDDTFRIQVWKKRAQTEMAFKGPIFTLLNHIRRLFGKVPLDPSPASRNFHLHSFLTYFLQIPTAEFLLVERLQFLQQIAKQFYTLHLRVVEIRDDFLFLNDFGTAFLRLDRSKIITPLEKLQGHIRAVEAHIEELNQFKAKAWQRFQLQETDIYQKMGYHWSFAGTRILSNADFGERPIAKCWKYLEAELAKSKESWIDHFQAEQGEWQAGIELSLLQLQTVQIYCDTLTSVAQNIHTQLIPTFNSTLETVAAFSKNVATMKIADDISTPEGIFDLKSATAKQNRALFQSLQQEKMPLMMDTLIKVQLDDLTKRYALRVRKAIEVLSDGHVIFLRRDLSNSVPKSETDDTHLLKAIVLEELFSKFKQGHQTFNAEYQHRIEKIIRGISEIDQLIEDTLEAALLRLERPKNQREFEEARATVIEDLKQVSAQVNELIAQAKQLFVESEKKLLELTKTFENQLLTLADTDAENKIEKYLLLARATAKEKLWNYRRKFMITARAALPTLFEVLINTIRQFQSNYFRLREMTGLAPDKADAGENLSRFLTDTEEHIKALPYVYQRLFRLAPLSDDRFFAARKAELDLLKQEFERWQNGKFTITALIGERGSGITTLLNFARQQIYKDYPIIKLDFLVGRTIFTDEALFQLLKSTFQELDFNHEPKNIDDLEDEINTLVKRKIVFAENLQQLFLRTTYGFDALERFMLFISRTHRKIHWILTCSLYSWEYFAKVLNIDEYVQQKIVFESLPQTEFEEIILKRHRASGYQLFFKPTDEIVQSRRYKKLKTDWERQQYLQSLFFGQLTELAAGNISVAMLFWLRSYEEFSENKLILPATINFDSSFLYQLPAEELFTLAALLQHDTLSTEDHALVFHQDVQQSHLLLNRMANKGFLVKQANGYHIHPFLYRPIVRVLQSDNIIH